MKDKFYESENLKKTIKNLKVDFLISEDNEKDKIGSLIIKLQKELDKKHN